MFQDRDSDNPNRRRLKKINGTADDGVFEITRHDDSNNCVEGIVREEGTPLNAGSLQKLRGKSVYSGNGALHDGFRIITNLPRGVGAGQMCSFTVQYNSYLTQMPTLIHGQFYLFAVDQAFYNCSCCVIGENIVEAYVFDHNGKVALWFPRIGVYDSLTADVWGTYNNDYGKDENIVTGIEINVAKPTSGYYVLMVIRKVALV